MKNIMLAVDLGGTITSIYRIGSGLVLKEPTLVQAEVTQDGYRLNVVGNEAKNLQGKTDERNLIFSPISQGTIKSEDDCKYMLKNFLDKVIQPKEYKNVTCLVTYPTGLGESDIDLYRKIFNEVGIKNLILLPKIIASAYGCDINLDSPVCNMVVDIGGVTTDIALLGSNSVIGGGTLGVGGKSIDVSIKKTILEKYNLDIGINVAQKVKEQIGSLYENDLANMEVLGCDTITNSPSSIIVYSGDIRKNILPLFDEVCRLIKTTLNLCSPELLTDIARNGIYICGGFAKTPGMETYLQNKIKLKINIVDDEADVCINGAGKLLANHELLNKIILNL